MKLKIKVTYEYQLEVDKSLYSDKISEDLIKDYKKSILDDPFLSLEDKTPSEVDVKVIEQK